MNLRVNCTLALSLVLAAGQPALAQETIPAQGLYFFESGLPKELKAKRGTVSLSGDHHKDGQQSLRWQFEGGGQLTFETPLTLGRADPILPRTFLVWVYNPKARADSLLFQFGRGLKTDAQFRASLDFSGWRGIAVPFRDMQGQAQGDLDRLTITAPAQGGELYLDQLLLNVPVDTRWPVPDRTVPFVNPAVNTAVNKNWNALLMYDRMLRQRFPQLNFSPALDDAAGDTATLYRRAEETMGAGEPPKVTAEAVDKLLKAYAGYGIRQNASGRIKGPALEYPTHLEFVKPEGVFPADAKKLLTTGTNNLRDIGKTLRQTALLLRSPELGATQKAELQQQFLLTTRYVLDQGLADGSGYQVVHHLGYQDRELFDAWFLARHLLAEQGLLGATAQAMMWYSGTGRIYTPAKEIVEANVDILNTQLQWMMKSILMLPDPAQRSALLRQLSGWLGQTILHSRGVAGGFKPDGSVFHHSQHYVAYAIDAFSGLAPAVYTLSGSPYALSADALGRLDDSLYKTWLYTKDTRIPLILSGRHPNDKYKISPEPFKWLALSGSPDGGQKVNPALAGVYARLSGQKDFAGVPAASEPSGAWAMNYAGMAIQKRAAPGTPGQSWTAIARGFSRYLVGNESYAANNLYGRYMLYGGLQIIPADPSKYNFSHDGWDWNHYPGTTSVELPWDALKANLVQLPAAGIEEMLLSTESYLGANDLGGNSMFAMKLHGHAKYGQDSLRARKSYFMFDNRIVALGSGIQDDDPKHATVTTLFQHTVAPGQPVMVGEKPISQPGREQLGGAVTLRDPAGNAYFIPAGQTVNLTYGPQTSPDDEKGTPTQGNFATAWLSHGKAPKDASYEYAVVVDAGQNLAAPGYTVLSRSDRLHAVRDGQSRGEDYAFFEAGEAQGGLVRASSAPAMVMAAPDSGGWRVSVVNPDLAFYAGSEADQVNAQGQQAEVSIYSRDWRDRDSQPQTGVITLNGRWQLAQGSSCAALQADGSTTRLTVTTTDALPCKVAVKP